MRIVQLNQLDMAKEFYVRYYVGHKGKFGHEFLEFEFRPEGKSLLQVTNASTFNSCLNLLFDTLYTTY